MPVKPEPSRRPTPATAAPQAQGIARAKEPHPLIFIVDDDPQVREATADVFTEEGYRVGTAVNGLEALRACATGLRPALVLLDLTMPVMDGHEFLRRRTELPSLACVPIIVLSATPAHLPDAPEVDVVGKPIDTVPLIELVAARLRATTSL